MRCFNLIKMSYKVSIQKPIKYLNDRIPYPFICLNLWNPYSFINPKPDKDNPFLVELPCMGHHRKYTPLPWKVFAKSLDKKCAAHFLKCLELLPNFKLKYVIFNSSFSVLTGKCLPWFKPQEWLQFGITIRRGLQFFLFQKISIPSLRAAGFTCP